VFSIEENLTFSRVPENTQHFASREGIARDAGQRPWNTGRPRKYGTVGNPTGLTTGCIV